MLFPNSHALDKAHTLYFTVTRFTILQIYIKRQEEALRFQADFAMEVVPWCGVGAVV
ncbi:hypothetical protein MNL13_06585 [Bartonella krasnovii]|uniref:Uncharacterized protein n=1 Tax=Bartonella krasnovii TaxID=2267275 RepID=A0ABY3VYX1_9HYPH|nr:hypothetical protein [Bartonella krasnovii]UNF28867.1 hypothetical protein MNL13_06585 [Bartonella krasnovii]